MRGCRILFVCMGNICRSPMAEGIFRHITTEHKQNNHIWTIDSAATTPYHTGQSPDPRACSVMRAHGISIDHLRARPFDFGDYYAFDSILVMDDRNMADLPTPPHDAVARVEKLTAYCQQRPGADIADPYYGGTNGFDTVYTHIYAACAGLLHAHTGAS